MRSGQVLSEAALLAEAQSALTASGMSQTDLARVLKRHRSTVSRALSETGGTFTGVQREIISYLTDFEVREAFVVERKA